MDNVLNELTSPNALPKKFEGMSFSQKVSMLEKAKEYVKTLDLSGHNKWFLPGTPYSIEHLPKHRAFFDAGKDYSIRALIAANRVGKTQSLLYEVACHATGIYPQWWKGRRWNRPVHIWLGGTTAEKVKEILQAGLLGEGGAHGTGMIPFKTILGSSAKSGVAGAKSEILVRHSSGGVSTIGLKSYKEGIEGWMGVKKDFVGLDEEPPQAIFNEAFMRVATTDGSFVFTFTPLKGYSELVVKLFEHAVLLCDSVGLEGGEALFTGDAPPENPNKAILQITWDDVPWLTEEAKEQQLRETPEHLKDARRKGIPAPGDGSVYPIMTDRITYMPGEVVISEKWPKVYGFDVGFNTTAAVWGAHDVASDTVYIYDEYVSKENLPQYHAYNIKSRGETIPGEIDPASNHRSAIDGKNLLREYRNLGLKLLPADNSVETGIAAVWGRMCTNRLKISSSCKHLLAEIQLYHMKDGKIIKKNDHAVDALRYLVQGLKHARIPNKSAEAYDDNTLGYIKF